MADDRANGDGGEGAWGIVAENHFVGEKESGEGGIEGGGNRGGDATSGADGGRQTADGGAQQAAEMGNRAVLSDGDAAGGGDEGGEDGEGAPLAFVFL